MPTASSSASSRHRALALLAGVAVAGCAAPGGEPDPTSSPAAVVSQPSVAQATCDRGWSHVTALPEIGPEGVAALGGELWIAGGADLGGGRRDAAVLHVPSTGAPEVEAPPPPSGRDSGMMAITADAAGSMWAVGYGREVDDVAAYSTWREGGSWRDAAAVPPDGRNGALTDVAAAPALGTWAAGFTQGPPGDRRPWALHWHDGAWATEELPLAAGEDGALAGVSVSDEGGVWVAGTVLAGPQMRPYLARREGGAWVRHDLEAVSQAALADITVPAPDGGWAAGHQLVGAGIEPLLLAWDGRTWTVADAPHLGHAPTLLNAVAEADGVLSVGGATWDPGRSRYVPFAARRALPEGEWAISVGRPGWGGGTVTDIVGDPGASGWVVGRADEGLVARLCEVAFAPAAGPSGRAPRATEAPAQSTTAARTPSAVVAATAPPSPVPLVGAIIARDVAAEVGLPTESQSWGASAADFDADGDLDLFLGRHGARARLFRNDGGAFTETAARFGGGDRHGCAATDVDDSGLPDLYCAFGAMRGTGTKQNQLWLDPGGPAPALEPFAGGASEPLGRGRQPRFLDLDEDGDLDLFLGQEAKRMDGLPSTNRGFLRTGPATFEAAPLPGIDSGLSAEAIDIADVDADGRADILFVYGDARALEPTAGLRLYGNGPGLAFTDLTEAMGIGSVGERDALLADLDGDGRTDLVQLAADRVVVSHARGGRFERVAEERVVRGAALASGDADGDGDVDLYVHQGKSAAGGRDLLLLNEGDGRRFERLDLPEVTGGSEDDVIALDYDGDGRMDFLALNGRNSARGPLQLITLESEG